MTLAEIAATDGQPVSDSDREFFANGIYVWPGPELLGSGRIVGHAKLGAAVCVLERRGEVARIDAPAGWIAADFIVAASARLRISSETTAVAAPRPDAEPVMRLSAGDTFVRGEVREGFVRLADAPVEAWVHAAGTDLLRAQ